MDLALNNLQRLMCHKTQQTNQLKKRELAKLWTLLSGLTTVKLKDSEKKDKYLDLVRELKKQWYMKVTVILIVISALSTVTNKGTGGNWVVVYLWIS